MAYSVISKTCIESIINRATRINRKFYIRNRYCTAEDLFVSHMDHNNIHKIAKVFHERGFHVKCYENSDYNKITAPFRPNQMLTIVISKKT